MLMKSLITQNSSMFIITISLLFVIFTVFFSANLQSIGTIIVWTLLIAISVFLGWLWNKVIDESENTAP